MLDSRSVSDDDPYKEGVQDAGPDLAAALHEVGNGLTVVLGWLEDARSQAEPGPVAEAIRIALERARRAHRIARRAITADTSRPDAEPISDLLEESIVGILPHATTKGVVLERKVEAAVAPFAAIAGERLLQVVTNLLLNALEATPAGKKITVEARLDTRSRNGSPHSGATLGIRIADGGPGIPPMQRPTLFQRGASGRPGGAGIGLAHAAEVVKEEGGRLSLEPWEPDVGAIFDLAWPLDGISSRISLHPMSQAPRTRRAELLADCRVAVLDDDAGVVDLLEMVLSARGAEVFTFQRHEDFLGSLKSASYDVALLDASPFGTSLEATLEELKRSHPDLDLILISGASDPGATIGKLGVTWIRKPFEVDEVVDVVRIVRGSSRSDK